MYDEMGIRIVEKRYANFLKMPKGLVNEDDPKGVDRQPADAEDNIDGVS